MLDFIVRWSEKAKSLVRANIIWNSSVHLQEQIRMYQVSGAILTFHRLSFVFALLDRYPVGVYGHFDTYFYKAGKTD